MYLRKLSSLIFIIISTIILIQSAYAQDIQIINVYSDLDSADITIHSEKQYSDITIDAELIIDGEALRSKQLFIEEIAPNSDITKILFWDLNIPPGGAYHTMMTLSMDGSVLETKYYNFSYGSPTIPRIYIKDIVPDSSGISVILAPYITQLGAEPIITDVEYMLLDGDTVIYHTTERRIIVDQATPLSKDWNVRLENNRLYSARIKAKISSPREAIIALSEDFTSMDDARITELFRDETGASVNVIGMSQVPYTGSIVFTVLKDGDIIEEIKEQSPILMVEDDETIEVSWKERLPPGIYELDVKVIGNDGDILDKWDTLIEAKQSNYAPKETPTASPPTPGFNIYLSIFSLVILILLSKRIGRYNG
ncbi:MAG: hypothetical protein IBX40_06390 [Methanosarcinales archaeon]|nr:hypothetical protein [Methanosarcinales archaeon]